jgi:hypothetical protein
MKTKATHFSIALMAFVIIFTSGCSAPKPAGLTEDELTAAADNVLKAVDAGDFQKFSQDLSDQMKAVFTEDQFNQLRTMLQNASGSYLSVEKPALTNNQGYAVYRFPASFEDETVYVTLTFLIGGQKIEGFFLDSTNLREAPVNP